MSRGKDHTRVRTDRSLAILRDEEAAPLLRSWDD
jgi:hypothetical protein